ncbi:MAG: DNA polymerase III subunit epsilon [Magnetospirillum sp. WYHS-4]
MREIVLDTETTGLNPLGGHRIVEIGCVELENHLPTGRDFHRYVNPERDVPAEAFAVHGLSAEFLSTHPTFADIAEDFLDFVGEAPLVIHNASFDLGFINAELARLDRVAIPLGRATDTVALARKRFPGAQANLDALCKRFGIDNGDRDLHGALKDSLLLAEVYLELIGGRQPGLALAAAKAAQNAGAVPTAARGDRPARHFAPLAEEEAAHRTFLAKLTAPIWDA